MQRATLEAHDPRMVGLLGYLRDHLDEPLDIEALARLAGVSARQLDRLFPRLFGESTRACLRRLRLERAARQLRRSRRRILAIAWTPASTAMNHLPAVSPGASAIHPQHFAGFRPPRSNLRAEANSGVSRSPEVFAGTWNIRQGTSAWSPRTSATVVATNLGATLLASLRENPPSLQSAEFRSRHPSRRGSASSRQ